MELTSDHEKGRRTDDRQKWGKKLEFMLATIGYAVGLGNVWRFPYLCFRSGGGAFLIPFFIMLILCGIPLAYMEMAVGQYTRQGPIGAIGKLCPFFKGAGVATVVISFLFTTYYIIIITWSFYYMFNTFTQTLPWTSCNHTWNSPHCWEPVHHNISAGSSNLTKVFHSNNSRSPTEDYFIENVLEKSSGIDQQGTLRWQLLLILMMCWILVYFCIWKGPKSTGKVVYFTATFPYLVLIILLVRGVTLPGSLNGIYFFIKPRWELLLDAKVWVYAAAQNFNSLGVAFGGLITMSSYSKFNNNIVRDVLTLAVVDAFTCLLAGFAIFSILGNLALNQEKEVEDVIEEGPGLVFVIYPQAFNTMPVSQLFAFLFFFMLVCLGIDSQFASVEVIVTTIQDHFAGAVKSYLKRKEVLVGIVCFISFLCGLPNITQGGFYFFQLIDYYAAALSLMVLAFFEVIGICWFYGAGNLAENIRQMTGSKPNIFFIACWYVLSPLLILVATLLQSLASWQTEAWVDCVRYMILTLLVSYDPLQPMQKLVNNHFGTNFFNSQLPVVDPCSVENGKEIYFCYLLLGIWIFSMIQYKPLSIAGYDYPDWAVAVGWIIALMSVVCIPAGMIQAVITTKGNNIFRKFINSFSAKIDSEISSPINLNSEDPTLTKFTVCHYVDQPDCQPPEKHCIEV